MRESKREKLAQFNRENILAAARELFETQGMERTTMDEVALRADCSKSTVYVYFQSKAEIFNTIVYESMALLRDGLEAALRESATLEDAFYALCGTMVKFQEEYPLYFDSILGTIRVGEEDFRSSPVLRETYEKGEEINALLTDAFRRWMEAGSLRKDLRPLPTIFMLWGSIGGIIKMADRKENYFREKLGLGKADFLHESFRLLLDSLRGGVQR
jgi:AcrR family transcriptional regulator